MVQCNNEFYERFPQKSNVKKAFKDLRKSYLSQVRFIEPIWKCTFQNGLQVLFNFNGS